MSSPKLRLNSAHALLAATVLLIGGFGCDVPIDRFKANEVFAKRLEITEGVEMSAIQAEVERVLVGLFGTPDEPRWPDFLSAEGDSLVSLSYIQRAAGAVRSDEQDQHFGLYREHCILCHGVSGGGNGTTSRLLNPYPRDFRLGKIKFKSTPIGKKPTRDDLLQTLLRGIAGTSMASFRLLPEKDLEALVDYTIFLSIRGEVERRLLAHAAFDADLESEADASSAKIELFAESVVREAVLQVVDSWQHAEESARRNVQPPEGFQLLADERVMHEQESAAEHQVAESVARGKSLFEGKIANCASCHGVTAMGDGVVTDFDDWTKDWTTAAGLDPNDSSSLRPMLELGALKPRPIQPRNLRSGIFRGGSRPEDLYLRIVNGIEGTPMPAVPLKPENSFGLSEFEVWDLVNYLLSLENSGDASELSPSLLGDRLEPQSIAAAASAVRGVSQ